MDQRLRRVHGRDQRGKELARAFQQQQFVAALRQDGRADEAAPMLEAGTAVAAEDRVAVYASLDRDADYMPLLDSLVAAEARVDWVALVESVAQVNPALASEVTDRLAGAPSLPPAVRFELRVAEARRALPTDTARARAQYQMALAAGGGLLASGPAARPADAPRGKVGLPQVKPEDIGIDPKRLKVAYDLLEEWTTGPKAPVPGAALLVGRGGKAVAPRFFAALCERPGILPFGPQAWGDTGLPLPWLTPDIELRDAISGRQVTVESDAQGVRVPVGELLTAFPVALLEYSDERRNGTLAAEDAEDAE